MAFTSALMAGANAGEGFLQGQRQRLQDKMNELIYNDSQLNFQKKQNDMAREQAEADYAMSLFNPTVQNPVTGQPVSGVSTPEASQQPTAPQINGQQFAGKMAAFAAGQGDPTGAMSYLEKGQKLAQTQAEMKQKELETSIKLGTQGAQDASLFPEGPQGASQFLAYEAQQGYLNPQQFANLKMAVAQDPSTWQARITQHGMTAAQQATTQLAQMKFDQQKANDLQEHKDRVASLAERQKYHEGELTNKARTSKGTGPMKDPSHWAQENTAPMIANLLELPVDAFDPTTGSPEMNRLNQNVQVAATAIVHSNPGITYPEAVKQVVLEMKQNGAFPAPKQTPTAMHWLTGGMNTGPQTVAPVGEDKTNALPFQQGETIIPGKVYKFPNGAYGRARGNGKFDVIQ